MAFVLAHEVAHHVLGHTATDSASLVESRQREMAADDWALDQCVKARILPTAGAIPLLFDYYVTAQPIAMQQRQTHPANVVRLEHVFARALDDLEGFRPEIAAKGISFEKYRTNLQRQLNQYKQAIRSDYPGK